MPNFTKILGTKEGGDHANRLKALREDLEDGLVLFLIYMPSVRKFFCEDVPRVVRNEPQVLFSMLSRGSAIANTAPSVKTDSHDTSLSLKRPGRIFATMTRW
ncbi:MAG: hypothetical protein JO266_14775 [Acidobacteria bacterium]|nr:hypothetical protein [Acidobacteriota bacterium]